MKSVVHSPVGSVLFAALSLVAVGCAHKPNVEPPTSQTVAATHPATRPGAEPAVHVSSDLERTCKIVVGSTSDAPKFDFDDSALLPEDRAVLDQVARCVTTGPLKGRALKLTGRADNRGTEEYNFALGAHRANTVERYLAALGVAQPKLHETSRGELDAKGNDDPARRNDRRVDIDLAQ
ncbi:MAG: peptidoglycan-associated outer rane lipoprotein [Myxococcaceae bacterium]|jgi:peptidoglycan-associated lipoprotein|nr:peptidoglycan-associated outer rane lipoprotein [Myxococcaceae bacterium]MEA2750472.1 peptidoglycan-associated lipoprotein [Myxococcales bacterium]